MQHTYAAEFGLREVEKVLSIELSKEENDAHTKKLKFQREHVKKVHGRMQEKIKEICQNLILPWSMTEEVVVEKLFFNPTPCWTKFMG